MRIAVTGASGFIGRHVLAQLVGRGIEVVALTRNAAQLAGLREITQVFEIDIAHPPIDCFKKVGSPDILIHLAWDGLSDCRSLSHFETELSVQYNFLKTMVQSGLTSLLVTGTCFEYGMQSGALTEDMSTKPNTPYGYAKDALRRQLDFLRLSKPFDLTWARLFYMYGEDQPSTSLYSALRKAVIRGDKEFNMSGGEQLRDYLSVEEVACQIVQLAMAQHNIGIINICSGKPISVRRLVEQWIHTKKWEISLNLSQYAYREYEPMAFWGDSTRMESFRRSCDSDEVT